MLKATKNLLLSHLATHPPCAHAFDGFGSEVDCLLGGGIAALILVQAEYIESLVRVSATIGA